MMRGQLRERFMVLAMVLAGTLWISQAFAAVTTYNIPLNSAQEVPTNGSTATGAAYLQVDDVARTVTYHITHNVVNQTAAHIHCCAPRGVNAGVIVTFPVGPGIKGVTAQLTAAQIASINAGQAYVNVHSTAFPGGEIRGQIDNISPSPGFNFCNAANCPGFSNTAFKVELTETINGFAYNRVEISVGKFTQAFKVSRAVFTNAKTGKVIEGEFKRHVKNPRPQPDEEWWSATFPQKVTGIVTVDLLMVDPLNRPPVIDVIFINTASGQQVSGSAKDGCTAILAGAQCWRLTPPSEVFNGVPIPAGVPQGFLVLVEGGDAKNPLGWSDVVAFNVPPFPGVAVLMSDTSPRGVGDIEKSLRAAGYSSDQVLNSNTVYFKESRTGRLNVYQAGNAFYNVYSDPPARVPGLNPAGMAALFALLATAGTVLVWRRKAASEFAA